MTERDRTISAAIAAGKFTEARRAHYEAAWAANPEQTRGVIAILASATPVAGGRTVAARSFAVAAATSSADPQFAANPLVDALRANNPALYSLAVADGPAPTMFEAGDLPLATASGIDPALLRQVPAAWRTAVAEAPSTAKASALIEESVGAASDGVAAAMAPHSEGWRDYVARVSQWASGIAPKQVTDGVSASAPNASLRAAAEDALYDSIWGAGDAAQEAAAARAKAERDAVTAMNKAKRNAANTHREAVEAAATRRGRAVEVRGRFR